MRMRRPRTGLALQPALGFNPYGARPLVQEWSTHAIGVPAHFALWQGAEVSQVRRKEVSNPIDEPRCGPFTDVESEDRP